MGHELLGISSQLPCIGKPRSIIDLLTLLLCVSIGFQVFKWRKVTKNNGEGVVTKKERMSGMRFLLVVGHLLAVT